MAKQPLLFNHVLPSQNFPLCSRLFKFHFEKKLLVFITIPPSLSINFWKQHSPGSALNPAVLNGVTLGVTLAKVGLFSYCSGPFLWSQAVVCLSRAGVCQRLQVSRGSSGSASLGWGGQTPRKPVPLPCRTGGYQAEGLFSLTVRTDRSVM